MEFGLVRRFGGDDQPSHVPVDPNKVKTEEVEGARRILEAEPFQGDAPAIEEDDDELDLKSAVLEIFSERYDRRLDSKELVFERALTDYKRLQANERKRPKDERELLNRVKAFARVQTAADYEVFVDGLLRASTCVDAQLSGQTRPPCASASPSSKSSDAPVCRRSPMSTSTRKCASIS